MILKEFINKTDLENSKKLLEFEEFFKNYKKSSWLDLIAKIICLTTVSISMYELISHFGNDFLHFSDFLLVLMLFLGAIILLVPSKLETVFIGKSFILCSVAFSLFYGAISFTFIIPLIAMVLFFIFDDKFLFSVSFIFFSYSIINLVLEKVV